MSADAYIYPGVFKFCPDIGLHKAVMNVGNHTAMNVEVTLSWLILQFSGHYITTRYIYYATKNHPRASCAWVASEIATTNILLVHYCLHWHYVWTKLDLYWQIQYLSRNRPVVKRYRELRTLLPHPPLAISVIYWSYLPYSQKIWQEIKFDGWAVYLCTTKLNPSIFLSCTCICMYGDPLPNRQI